MSHSKERFTSAEGALKIREILTPACTLAQNNRFIWALSSPSEFQPRMTEQNRHVIDTGGTPAQNDGSIKARIESGREGWKNDREWWNLVLTNRRGHGNLYPINRQKGCAAMTMTSSMNAFAAARAAAGCRAFFAAMLKIIVDAVVPASIFVVLGVSVQALVLAIIAVLVRIIIDLAAPTIPSRHKAVRS